MLITTHFGGSVAAVDVDAFEYPYEAEKNGGQPVELKMVVETFIHPNYNKKHKYGNDFGLLKLFSPSTLAPVPMDSVGESERVLVVRRLG